MLGGRRRGEGGLERWSTRVGGEAGDSLDSGLERDNGVSCVRRWCNSDKCRTANVDKVDRSPGLTGILPVMIAFCLWGSTAYHCRVAMLFSQRVVGVESRESKTVAWYCTWKPNGVLVAPDVVLML